MSRGVEDPWRMWNKKIYKYKRWSAFTPLIDNWRHHKYQQDVVCLLARQLLMNHVSIHHVKPSMFLTTKYPNQWNKGDAYLKIKFLITFYSKDFSKRKIFLLTLKNYMYKQINSKTSTSGANRYWYVETTNG